MCSTLDTASLNSIFESYNYTDFSSPPVPSGFTPSSSRHTSLSRLSQSSRTTRTLRAGGAQSLTRCCSRSHQRKFQQISTGERKKKKGGKGKKKKNNHSPLGVYSLGRSTTGQYCYTPCRAITTGGVWTRTVFIIRLRVGVSCARYRERVENETSLRMILSGCSGDRCLNAPCVPSQCSDYKWNLPPLHPSFTNTSPSPFLHFYNSSE